MKKCLYGLLICIILSSTLSVVALASTDSSLTLVAADQTLANKAAKETPAHTIDPVPTPTVEAKIKDVKQLRKSIQNTKALKKESKKKFATYSKLHKSFCKKINTYLNDTERLFRVDDGNFIERSKVLNRQIKLNTKKYNECISKKDSKNADYYLGLISQDRKELEEIQATHDEDYEVFISIKKEVTKQRRDAKSVYRKQMKRKTSFENTIKKIDKRFNKILHYAALPKEERVLTKQQMIISVGNTVSNTMKRITTFSAVCDRQITYFNNYANTTNQ